MRNKPIDRYVYFFLGHGGQIKIGCSSDPHRRFRDLKCRGVWTCLAVIPGNRFIEHEWHVRFAHLCRGSDWFQVTPELLNAIEAAPERMGLDEAETTTTTIEDEIRYGALDWTRFQNFWKD